MDLLKRHQALAIEKERKKIERWSLTRAKGKWRFILLFALQVGLVCGTVMAITFTFQEKTLSFQRFVWSGPLMVGLIFVVIGTLLGLIFGWRQWNFYEGIYLKSMRSNNKD